MFYKWKMKIQFDYEVIIKWNRGAIMPLFLFLALPFLACFFSSSRSPAKRNVIWDNKKMREHSLTTSWLVTENILYTILIPLSWYFNMLEDNESLFRIEGINYRIDRQISVKLRTCSMKMSWMDVLILIENNLKIASKRCIGRVRSTRNSTIVLFASVSAGTRTKAPLSPVSTCI